MKMLVIADDFTGANDTGVQLAKKGARTEVVLGDNTKLSGRADVLVINTESRALSATAAKEKVTTALRHYSAAQHGTPVIYKKIDSTFRGNVGAEVEALLIASQARIAIVAAAIPAAGRTTVQGECRVNQVPLAETEFATDPKTPICSSRIKTLINLQSTLPVYEVGLDEIRGPMLASRLNALAQEAVCIAVLDAESDGDLALIAQSLEAMNQPFMLVGAAGLANALSVSFYRERQKRLPVLVVAGSMSEATRRQIEFAAGDKSLGIVDIDVEQLLQNDDPAIISELVQRAVALLQQEQHCVLRTCRNDQDRLKIDNLCLRYHFTRQVLGENIGRWLGEITRQIINQSRIGGLFLTGGDIAIAVARALGAQGYRIEQEVTPCVPCGTFVNSDIDDLPVITKAGGFGDESTLRDALYFIEEMYSDE
nr:four-carbon acid sugar kinase family protein [Pantoea sp. 201603H]